jgi:peptidoglycan hydrolase CwlO-like protein
METGSPLQTTGQDSSRPMAVNMTPKSIIGLSVAFLGLAAIFGILNAQKAKSLRESVATALNARDDAERRRAAEQKELKTREANVTTAMSKVTDNEGKVAKAEADLVKLQTEKAELQTKLQAAQTEVTSLQSRVEEAGAKPSENPGAPSLTELQAQLDEARHQLENAEHENTFLSEKIRNAQESTTRLEEEKKHRSAGAAKAGVRGIVLAVNQAYNFVVLNLGGRQGVEPNAEMLVFREGTMIGKIRVSSVEPSTAIGDIISGSLARGVQVQPGDIVVYAGTNS